MYSIVNIIISLPIGQYIKKTIEEMSKGVVFALTLALTAIVISIYTLKTNNQTQAPADLDFVKDMDFKRFMGVWYNIASLPNAIQSNCKCGQTYDTLMSQLVIELSESCLFFGKNVTSKSKAVAKVNGYGNWTNLNGPLQAPYWIINLDKKDYQWVVIGQPSRKGFWIMNRKPLMDQTLLRELIAWGETKQFNLKNLEFESPDCIPKIQNKLQIKQDGSIQSIN